MLDIGLEAQVTLLKLIWVEREPNYSDLGKRVGEAIEVTMERSVR